MRVDTISALLDRYGQCVTLYRGGVEAGREVRAFLQPLREAGREQARPSPLGLRREEICGLKWESVDFQRRVVHIKEARTAYGATVVQKETKNRSSMRTLFMPDELYELLRREKARQEQERAIRGGDYAASGHVVLDREGLPYSPNALSLAFTRFVRKNHLPRLTLHGLRHTFATIASAQGVPLFDIGKAMGHSTPATPGRIYTHLVDRTHEETLLLVSAALK